MEPKSPTPAVELDVLINAVVDYAIYMLDGNGHVLSWNTGAERLKGYARAEILGEHFSRFYTEDDRKNGVPAYALETARKEGRFLAEGWRVRKDGSRFWASVVIDAIMDKEGKVAGFAKVTRDFTERRELLESERRFRRLVDAVVDYAIFQLDVQGNVATWNAGAERIKGYSAGEIVGRHFSVFYTSEDRAAGVPDKALSTAATVGKYETVGWRVRKDGTSFRASVVIDAIYDDGGKLAGFAKVTRDITESHEAQEKLRKAQEHAAASQKMEAIGQLSGGIAHDFNNLLMIVLGNVETAQRYARQHPDLANLQRVLANAMRGAQRAAALTSRLLAFSRRQALDPKPLNLNKYLNGSADFIQRSLGETVQIELVGAAGLWPIEADHNQLESALVNLAINARDAMPDGGKLTIEASNVFADAEYLHMNPEVSEGQYVVICVSDTGTGMSGEVLGRAFEPFFTTKEIGQGTGLGLSQVYGFVKQSGGHVKIYSEVGHGTTVKLYFPRLIRSGDEDLAPSEEIVAEAEDGETILVVEDDADLRAYLVDTLRPLNYRVLVAGGGDSALTLLADPTKRIDAMLTDVIMPQMNGRELALKGEEIRPGLPVIYMTGYSRNALAHQGRLKEGVDFIQKPISQTELAARIRQALDRKRGGSGGR